MRAALLEAKQALDSVWESCEMGWIVGGAIPGYRECGECGASTVNPTEQIIHTAECVQGEVHHALARINAALRAVKPKTKFPGPRWFFGC